MPTNDEDGKVQPEVSQVQGQGDCDGLLALRRERMERDKKSFLWPLQRDGVSPSSDPQPLKAPDLYPNRYRFYTGAIGIGMMLGITWTISMTTANAQRWITKPHAYVILYAVAVFFMVYQGVLLYLWNKRLKRHRAEIDKFLAQMQHDQESFKERYGFTDEE